MKDNTSVDYKGWYIIRNDAYEYNWVNKKGMTGTRRIRKYYIILEGTGPMGFDYVENHYSIASARKEIDKHDKQTILEGII